MKPIYHLLVIFFFVGCGKTKDPSRSTPNKTFIQSEVWNQNDDDADGISNGEEIQQGTHPELINPPNLASFELSNVVFYLKESDAQVNQRPLRFVIDDRPINRYLLSVMAPVLKKSQTPFQNYQFKNEHISVQTNSSFLMPNIFFFRPKLDANYLKFLNTTIYNNKVSTNIVTENDLIHANITLNFPANLSMEKWTKIEGDFKWGEKTIPWSWSKEITSQQNWQITLNSKDWLSAIKDELPLIFTIRKWEVATALGQRFFDEQALARLTPFYVLTTKSTEAGWYNTKFPLPAAAIVNRPTENNSTLPWYFFRLENAKNSTSTYWLKELQDQELDWFENGLSLKWVKTRLQDDLKFLPLPPHKSINALKIKLNSHKYVYPLKQNPKKIKTGKLSCVANYPKFPEKTATVNSSEIEINRLLKSIYINTLPLNELIKSKIYLKIEYNKKNKIQSLTLNWPKDFVWNEFSILGLQHEVNTIIIDGCQVIAESDNKYWPVFKTEDLYFEWLY